MVPIYIPQFVCFFLRSISLSSLARYGSCFFLDLPATHHVLPPYFTRPMKARLGLHVPDFFSVQEFLPLPHHIFPPPVPWRLNTSPGRLHLDPALYTHPSRSLC